MGSSLSISSVLSLFSFFLFRLRCCLRWCLAALRRIGFRFLSVALSCFCLSLHRFTLVIAFSLVRKVAHVLQLQGTALSVVFVCCLPFSAALYLRSVSLVNSKSFIARRGIDYVWFY